MIRCSDLSAYSANLACTNECKVGMVHALTILHDECVACIVMLAVTVASCYLGKTTTFQRPFVYGASALLQHHSALENTVILTRLIPVSLMSVYQCINVFWISVAA